MTKLSVSCIVTAIVRATSVSCFGLMVCFYHGVKTMVFEEERMYRIWCEVWGGVTGYREAWLKVEGKIYETDNHAEALEKAEELNFITSKFTSSASFRYTVEEF